MVLIAIGTGVGAGIILNGTLYRGHGESAGEIGYLVPSREMLRQSYPHFGALESLASGTAISQRARTLLASEPGQSADCEPTAQEVFEAARRGEHCLRVVCPADLVLPVSAGAAVRDVRVVPLSAPMDQLR